MEFGRKLAMLGGTIAVFGSIIALWKIYRIFGMYYLDIKGPGQEAAQVGVYAILIAATAAIVALIGVLDIINTNSAEGSAKEKGFTARRKNIVLNAFVIICIVVVLVLANLALSLPWTSSHSRVELEIESVVLQTDADNLVSNYTISIQGTIVNEGLWPGSGDISFAVSDGRGFFERRESHVGLLPGDSESVGGLFAIPEVFDSVHVESTPIWWSWEIGFSDYEQLSGVDQQIEKHTYGPLFF